MVTQKTDNKPDQKQAIYKMKYEVCAIRPEALEEWADPVEPMVYSTAIDKEGRATIYIQDALVQKPIFSWQEASCYETIKKEIGNALTNSTVKEIWLDIDSPGGSVLGVSDLAEYIFANRNSKPIIAYINSMAASAAYWIASACSKVILASETTLTGSIGVVSVHVDTSKNEANYGVKITEIVAGKYKRIASQHVPLEEEGRAVLQSQVDEYYQVFVSSVAKYRSKSIDEILLVADGKEYIGSKAISAGLADEIKNGISVNNNLIGEKNMDLEQLKQENEQLKQEIEQLKKELEDLKKSKENSPQEPPPQEPPSNAKLEEKIAMAIKQDRERMFALDEMITDEVSKKIVMDAKKNGLSVGDTAYSIVVAHKKESPVNFRAGLEKENKIIPTGGSLPTHEEIEQNNLIACATNNVNKRRK